MDQAPEKRLNERIYLAVQQVPYGLVSTYGDIATIVGEGCDARTVGYALNEVPKQRAGSIPWQRIINREGGISTRGVRQRELLEAEGVTFDARERADMARVRWAGPTKEWATQQGFNTLSPAEPEDPPGQLRLF